MQNKYFENAIFGVILVSALVLVIDTYENNIIAITIIDEFNTSVFFLECFLKIIALGFFIEEGTYLRDSWNKLDFTIVVFGIIDLALINYNLSFIKVSIIFYKGNKNIKST